MIALVACPIRRPEHLQQRKAHSSDNAHTTALRALLVYSRTVCKFSLQGSFNRCAFATLLLRLRTGHLQE
jgi:hypothetical protein